MIIQLILTGFIQDVRDKQFVESRVNVDARIAFIYNKQFLLIE